MSVQRPRPPVESGADIKVRVVIGVGLLKITSHVHHVRQSPEEPVSRLTCTTRSALWRRACEHERTPTHQVLDRLHNQLTWTLDPSKPSDLVQNNGHWLLREEPARPNSTAVYYSATHAHRPTRPPHIPQPDPAPPTPGTPNMFSRVAASRRRESR